MAKARKLNQLPQGDQGVPEHMPLILNWLQSLGYEWWAYRRPSAQPIAPWAAVIFEDKAAISRIYFGGDNYTGIRHNIVSYTMEHTLNGNCLTIDICDPNGLSEITKFLTLSRELWKKENGGGYATD